MKLSGAEILIESLIEQGTEVIFGYPGGSVLDIYDALYRSEKGPRHVLASHEQGATHAADGYARATGKTGVALTTSGPGATNAVTGIATAQLDSVPMIVITGNVPLPMLGKDSFQEVDIVGITIPITKHNFLVKNAKDIAEVIKKAFTIANSARPGTVLIDIPKDVSQQLVEYVPAGKYKKRPYPKPSTESLEAAVQAISTAQKPFIYFGGGVKSSGAEKAIMALSEKIDAPLAATVMGLSCVPFDYPRYIGMIGMHGRAACNKAAVECDVLIVVGARFSDRVVGDTSKFAKKAKIIHIELDPSEIGKNVDVHLPVRGDAKEVLEALTAQLQPQKHPEWNAYLQKLKKEVRTSKDYPYEGVDPREVIEAVSKTSGYNAIVATDVGQHQMLVAHHYKFTQPNTFLSSCGLGTMGFGLGAANGAKIGHPERPVVLFTGDGSFHMNMAEMAVAISEKLAIIVIIFNNASLGMVKQWQNLFYEQRFSASVPARKTDFVKLAEAFGATGFRIDNNDQVEDVITKAFKVGGPVIIDCLVDKNFGAFPLIPAGKAYNDMILDDTKK